MRLARVGLHLFYGAATVAAVYPFVTHDRRRRLKQRWSQRLLEIHYGLTPAEARVVRSLLGGLRVQTAAQELHLSPETVRKHLKHAMRKLDVSTQAQMVQVIASGPGR